MPTISQPFTIRSSFFFFLLLSLQHSRAQYNATSTNVTSSKSEQVLLFVFIITASENQIKDGLKSREGNTFQCHERKKVLKWRLNSESVLKDFSSSFENVAW